MFVDQTSVVHCTVMQYCQPLDVIYGVFIVFVLRFSFCFRLWVFLKCVSIFLLAKRPISALGPTHPPLSTTVLSRGKLNAHLRRSAEVKNEWSNTATPPDQGKLHNMVSLMYEVINCLFQQYMTLKRRNVNRNWESDLETLAGSD